MFAGKCSVDRFKSIFLVTPRGSTLHQIVPTPSSLTRNPVKLTYTRMKCSIFSRTFFQSCPFLYFRECKYEQEQEFSTTARQLNYRRAKEEKQKKIKRLKQLQKIQQGQKRRSMKRVGTRTDFVVPFF